MAKGYWITFYRSIKDESALARYAKLAGPIIESKGGRILGRGNPVKVYEAGVNQRSVVIEFESVQKAIEGFESPEYQEVAAILKGAAERDIRIIPGV
ncbi:MAG TPA: DUF1330 domain-containing protein [Acidobacteriota bacterium]|nr:DUF1330 domain-containing protein [Acidobacteriota bacterium]